MFRRNRPLPHEAATRGFYRDTGRDFEVRIMLGRANAGGTDPGEVLAAIAAVGEHDNVRWYTTWHDLGLRMLRVADECAAAGHLVSAASTYLRASSYLTSAVNAVDGLDSDDALLPTFREHRRAWERFIDLSPHPAERVTIPYENTTLPGWFFRPAHAEGTRPTFVMVNGSDGDVGTLWSWGGAGAVARGYNVLIFDGPGQQSMLFERGVPFRPDWENVLTPVLDFVQTLPGVDPDQVVVYGVSQAGYWVPRALAFEHRFAAAVADPGVVSVIDSWLANFPEFLRKLFEAGEKKKFDRLMRVLMRLAKQTGHLYRFRARPYGIDGYYDTLAEVKKYDLTEVAVSIDTPLLITDPDDEQFWPGQSPRLAELVGANATLVRFTTEEGANWHCQPMARALTDQRMFDWLDDRLAERSR